RKSPPPGVAETSMASREAVVRALESGGGVLFRMVEPDERPSGTGQRLGAPESMGISTLEPGQRPPTMPPGRQVSIRVQMLDDTLEVFQVSHRAPGKVLFDLVCSHLNLIEGDYFGLEFQDQRKMTVWLDLLKPILKQIRRPKNSILRMVVKFFPPDHTLLLEELTRYLFALQIKHDLACGRLTCNESSAALLVSHIVQSEIGDFDEVQCKQHLLNNKYIPEQDTLMDKVMEYHRKHVGQTPAESDYQLLEIARRLEMYGVRLHPAKDREGTKLSLAVAHSGVLVFQGHTKINAFNWSKVRKLSFKRKRFLIKLRPDLNQSNCQDTLEFMMGSRDCCKVFWKICVEYHAFFRLFEEPKPKPKPVLFTRGSSFRFSGRTQRQVIDYVKDSEFKKVPFERKHSKIQFNSLSPFPSRLSAEGQGEKNASASGPQAESPIGRTQVTVENPALQRYTGSLTYQTNGCRNGNHDEMDTRLKPSPSKQQPEHLSTGPVNRSPLHSEVMVNGQKQTLSPDGPQPSPLTSPLLNDAGFIRMDDEDEVRRKRFPTDKAYFITKELLTTERTYLKDLEVITVSFQNSVGQDEVMSDSLKKLIFANFEPVYKFHESFLKDVEQREGRSNAHIKGDYQCIGDIMLKNIQGLKLLSSPLRLLSEALLELERSVQLSRRLESLCKDFQQQKVCYLPLNVFFLRPLHRLLHYKLMLERLCKHYPPTHQDFRDSRAALADISEMVLQLNDTLMKMENFQKLLELKKDLVGVESLIAPAREFIRLGCLSKLSGKGLQQRMFFLIRESEDEWGVPHSFTLSGQRQSVVVAASSASEMEKWLEDIRMAVELADQCNGPSAEILSNSFTEHKSPEECVSEHDSEDDLSSSRSSLERQTPQRGNTSVTHVCWHRNTSVSMLDFNLALENQLSGNLLRKFKNSNGWQKLWVVFTNFSLFFYKTHQDEYPLASLPLLGYSITVPSEAEQIQKDYVFKLHFKSHVYYFRSESEYTFERWMEVIRSATCSYSHSRPSSRKELLVY
ncbi:hypothetical protein DNTS_012493, partial [Danionella cerebrum]